MKKRGALLVFLLAGAMAIGVGVGAGCKKGDNSGNGDIGDITSPDGHRHNYEYKDNGNGTHRGTCTMEGCEVTVDNLPHVDTAGGGPNGKCDYCGVVIGPVEEDKVTSVLINGVSKAKLGESVTLTATVEGTGNFDKSVAWEIVEGPATINDGVVTAVVAGTVKVKAVSIADKTKYDEHTIVFEKDNSSVEETVTVAISGSDSVTVNKSVTLTATVLPDTLTDRTVTWSVIDGTGKATITAEGVLTGTKEGTVTVVAISKHDDTASAMKLVTVQAASTTPENPDNPNPDNPNPDNPNPDNPNPDNPNPDNPDPDNPDIPDNPDPEEPTVLTEDTALKMTAGETKTLSAAAGTEWTTSDATVATVNSDGVISAKTAGVTKIRANVDGVITICTVIVQPRKSSGGDTVTKDPFSFKKTVDIGSVESGGDIVVEEKADEYSVRFSDGVPTQHVASGGLAVKPVGVEKAGYYRQGWYTSAAYTTEYDFSKPVTGSLNLVAKWQALPAGVEYIEGNQESISLIWTEGKPAEAKVEYSVHGENNWKRIDQELIRKDGLNARADVLGISKGVYDVKITTSAGDEKLLTDIRVDSYDRSGYAHFNYTNGVGAYNDDGTLKDNALVIYVTNENKDTVMEQVCAANSDVNMFQIPNYGGGKDWGGKNASGIGWWLNNNQYTASNAGSAKNKRPSNTYDQANGGKLGFKSVDRPIVIRFIGTVETPEGCTAYNDPDEGGGVGDNGHMARLKNLKNITLEGVGDNAQIKGWGFHFVKGTDAVDGQGTSFEVRNLTFNEYPEDAIGMEGQQSGSEITAGVER